MTYKTSILEDFLELVTYGFTNPMPDSDSGPWKITAKDVIDGEINFDTARKTTLEAFETKLTKKSRPKLGDVLLTKDGTLGRLAIVRQEDICVNQSVAVLRPNKKVTSEYLFYLLSTPEYQTKMIGDADGTVIKHIYITRVGKMEVRIPSLEEQNERVKHLIALDKKIKLNTQTNQTLEQIAQAIFKSWFVDFDPVKAKIAVLEAGGTFDQAELAAMSAISAKNEAALKQLQAEQPEAYAELAQTAALFPSKMVDSELGEIPEGWEVKIADDLYKVSIGKTPPRKEPQWFSADRSNVKWLSIKDMGSQNVFTHDTSEFLTREAVKKFNVKVMPKDTIFLSFKLTVGRVSIANDLICTNEAIAHFPPSKTIPWFWLYLYLRNFDYSKLGSTSSIATAVNSKTIKLMPILVVPTQILKVFENHIGVVFETIRCLETEQRNLTEIRDALLPKLLSGELPIPETDEANA